MALPAIMTGAPLKEAASAPSEHLVRKARGCMLGLMVGDALGAAVEGWDRTTIRELAQTMWGKDLIQDYISAVPMGTFVPGKEPGTYRPALAVNDVNFVPSGPPSNDNVANYCARRGMYTDDTNSCLAVAMSLVEQRQADAAHVARSCANLFLHDNEAFRGCPPTAKNVLELTLQGVSPAETGLPPNFPYAGGSFANGGAMRISPLGIAYRNADTKTLRDAVTVAICASHRHPEAIDFAVVQASAVQHALLTEPDQFHAPKLLAKLASLCETEQMCAAITATAEALGSFQDGGDELETIGKVVDDHQFRRPGSGMGFQIASLHMAPCVLWAACLHHRIPRRAIQAAIDLGGDTDTTASMVGAIVGALHGEEWCKSPVDLAGGLENGAHGREFALRLAEQLARLDLACAE